jgi:cytochrome oxidase Cu insertion factor (SCO1/SenC/PrrC family)
MHPLKKVVVGGGIVASTLFGATSCNDTSKHTPNTEQNSTQVDSAITHEGLKVLAESGTKFLDPAGNVVNLSDIQKRLNGKKSTISFMFASCPVVCPTTASALKTISDNDSTQMHIVIAVDGADDFHGSIENGEKISPTLAQKLKYQGLDSNKTLVLLPLGLGKNLDEQLEAGEAKAEEIQNKLKLVCGAGDHTAHSPEVISYHANGKANKYAGSPDPKEIAAQVLGYTPQKQPGR